jgi:hypothetical protein
MSMQLADRAWRRGVVWAVIYALAALALLARSLQIALRLDSLRGAPAWPDWLLALVLALALAGAAGLFARSATLRRERWLWRQAKIAEDSQRGLSVPSYDQAPQEETVALPLTLTAEWRPLWLRILLSPFFVVGMALALGCALCAVYWGLLIVVLLAHPEFVYHPALQMRFFYYYALIPVFPFGVILFGAFGMVGFPWAPKLIVDEEGMTRISSLGRRRSIRWEDARLLECSAGDRQSDLGDYRHWTLSSARTTITWDSNLARSSERLKLAKLIHERAGLTPYELEQRFWRRSPLVARVVQTTLTSTP